MHDDWDRRGQRAGISRRDFLAAAAMVGLAGTAGATAWLVALDGNPIPEVTPTAPPTTASQYPTRAYAPPIATAAPLLDLSGQLAAVQGDKQQLQAALDTAEVATGALQGEVESYRAHLAEVTAQLQAAYGRIDVLGGLIGLYSQLDSLALDDVVETSLGEVASLALMISTRVPLLREGLAAAATVLNRLELALPAIRSGLSWLRELVNRLADSLQTLEDALEETVEPLMPLAQKLAAFAHEVLGWVPFGVGQGIERGFNGIVGVLTHIPELVRSVGPAVLEPVGEWFDGRSVDQVAIKTSVIDPLRGQALGPASDLADEVLFVEEQLRDRVAAPLQDQLDARRPVRERVTQYRQQYRI